jgi:putative transposase
LLEGGDALLLEERIERRRRVYEEARRRNPARWSGDVRTWASPEVVVLNPAKDPQTQAKNQAIAA